MENKKIPTIVIYLFSFTCIIAIWQIFAVKVGSEFILPTPAESFETLKKIVFSKVFWQNFWPTFLRVLISFGISVVLGAFIGFLCGISSFAKDFFEIPMSIIRATPVIAFILVAYFWFRSNVVPVFVTVLMTLPIMITSVCTGFEKADKDLLNMAKVYNFSKKEIIKYIKIPQAVPYFLNGAISCFGLSWKVVAAGEVICLPKKAVGTMLQKAQLHLETKEVIAETIVLVLVSFVIERIFSLIVEKGARNE